MQLLFGYIGAITTVGLSPCLFLVVRISSIISGDPALHDDVAL